MASIVTSGGFSFSFSSTGGTWSWTVQANNQINVGQNYQFTNIMTPWGPLVNTQIPIPSDVIIAMSDSLVSFQQQLLPLLALVLPSTTYYSVIVTEGDPDITFNTIALQNVGAFGSFMTVTATPNASWLTVSPTVVQNLAKNEQTSFGMTVLASQLLNSGSPYSGVLMFQDNRVPSTLIPVIINATVLPRPAISTSTLVIGLNYILATMTPGVPQTLAVTNSGPDGSTLDFTIANITNLHDWLDISPSYADGLTYSQSVDITLSVLSSGAPVLQGTYEETIRISSLNSSNGPIDVTVTLTVI